MNNEIEEGDEELSSEITINYQYKDILKCTKILLNTKIGDCIKYLLGLLNLYIYSVEKIHFMIKDASNNVLHVYSIDETNNIFNTFIVDILTKYPNIFSTCFIFTERERLENGNIKNKKHMLSNSYNAFMQEKNDEAYAQSLKQSDRIKNLYNNPIFNTFMQNLLPQIITPQNTIPQNTIPQNTIPQNTIPQIITPQNITLPLTTSSPNTEQPNITSPNTEQPNITYPNTTQQNITTPNTEQPNITSPNTEQPNITSPNTEQPNITSPNTTQQNIETPPIIQSQNIVAPTTGNTYNIEIEVDDSINNISDSINALSNNYNMSINFQTVWNRATFPTNQSINIQYPAIEYITRQEETREDVVVTLTDNELSNIPCYKFNEYCDNNECISDKCTICLSKFENNSDICFLKCKHIFHKECIHEWLKNNSNKCPICRNEVSKGKADFLQK
jgi:hypothetical protein